MAVPFCSEGNTDRNAPSQHPIGPPQELRVKWRKEAPWDYRDYIQLSDYLIAQAAQWGWDQRAPEIQAAADAELKACCKWLKDEACFEYLSKDLRAARRPKPSTLKERALNDLSRLMSKQVGMFDGKPFDTIRQALETLPDE